MEREQFDRHIEATIGEAFLFGSLLIQKPAESTWKGLAPMIKRHSGNVAREGLGIAVDLFDRATQKATVIYRRYSMRTPAFS